MSRVKDLEIRGVRNFGDENSKARIHFSKPLTLILGPNGTGKTTIIEALKYVTSGEYPPDSDRGKCFVHEPKLTLNHTVRGQVKARIIDKRGKELIVTRTMQVTRQKNNALKFQALDNTITTLDEVTKEVLWKSYHMQCCDIDREMLIAMGVSKPILNYVIFCHQEESNWPLEDGKKLKDRFDEIFDTSKYNKAMDVTTKLIKDLHSELNVLKAYESGLKDMVDEVHSQEEKLRDSETRKTESENRIEELNESAIPVEDRMKKIIEVEENYSKLKDKIKRVETDYKVTENSIESLKKHIKKLYNGTKEELVQKIQTYDENLTQKATSKKKHEKDLEIVEEKEENLFKELDDTRTHLGSLRQKRIALEEKTISRNQLLSKILKAWKISQSSDSLTEEEVIDYINQVQSQSRNFAKSIKNKFEENQQEEKYVQEEVDSHSTAKTKIESEISLKETEKSNIKTEIGEIRQKIKQTDEANDRLNSVESNLQNAIKTYDNLTKNFDENFFKDSLQEKVADKKELSTKLSQIDAEIDSLHQQSTQQAELELHQKSVEEKEKDILLLQNKNKDNLKLLFDEDEIPKRKLKENLDKIQKDLYNEKNNLVKQIDKEQQNVTKLKTTLKYSEQELLKTNKELEVCREKVFSHCQSQDYSELLLLQERKVKSLQDQRGIYANQSLMYKDYLKHLKKKSCCPLCERNFQNSSEEKTLADKLNSEIKNSPKSLEECEKKLKEEQTRYDSLQQLKPITEQIATIENQKLPNLRNNVEKTKKDLQQSEENLENLKLVLSEPEEKLNIYKKIVEDVILLDKYINEKDRLMQIIDTRKRDMRKAGKIGDRSMQEAQNERETLKNRISKLENEIENLQSTLQEGQEKIQKAREQKNKLNEEVIHIRQSLQALKQLKDKNKELFNKNQELERSLISLRQGHSAAEEKLFHKVEELNDLKRKHREEQQKDNDFRSENERILHGLLSVQEEVRGFIDSKIEENLKEIQMKVEETKKECDKQKTIKLNLQEQIRFLDEQCRSQVRGKEELEHNLDLMEKEEYKKGLNVEITKLKKLLEDMKFDKLSRDYEELKAMKENYEREKSACQGRIQELVNSIRTLRSSLNQEKYRMARHNYKKNQLQSAVQEEAILNLKEYVTVLDKAMIQFHEERMNTVNKIMGQLWSLVYGGNDTSTIQIRVQTTAGIGDKKRSYNYKLVQVKRSTEMDMKGKCSAGQKVLASIIIRMALAETFCNECAVLALDEPTTNLDDENATNLAVTLSKVIQLRAQHHKNFQLIVISHDEKFISHLSNLSGKQAFQELYRNRDGYSLVRRRDMTEYTKDDSQGINADNYDDESEDEEEQQPQPAIQATNKRNLSMDDSPQGRAAKRRAYF